MTRRSVAPGRWRRLGAALAAAFVAFTTAVPGAGASPTPKPYIDSNGVRLIVPPDQNVDTEAQMDAKAEELLSSPMGLRLTVARRRFSIAPGNVSVEWFDFSRLGEELNLKWFHPDDYETYMLNALGSAKSNFKISGDYHISARRIFLDGNEDLYQELGANRGDSLIEVASSNVFHGTHSEQIPLARIRAASPLALRRMNKGITTARAAALTETILARSSAGLVSENSPCLNKCDRATSSFRTRLAIARYGRTGTPESAKSVATVQNVMGKARSKLNKRLSEKYDQDRRTVLGAPCDTGSLGGGLGEHNGLTAPVTLAFQSSCTRPKQPSGGLSKALTSQNLGGVDFSTLEMRYMSDSPNSGGVQYSFSGRPAGPGTDQDLMSDLDALTNSAADLRTWLVLDPGKFWVNLNPTQPDKIVDPQLGQTNAGRALLEADFAMKRTASKLLDPDTSLGARYWRAFGKSGSSCYTSRFWIVPGDVQVREAGSSLYILKATLAVKTQSMHIDGLAHPCHSSPESDARNERLEKAMVVPKVAEAVNNAPEYAPIRRAFIARVLAQWIRDRHREGHPTSFDDLVDSGDLGPAKLEGGWRPRQVFDSYVRSIQAGEFTYHQALRNGSVREIKLGGVDFSKIDSTPISAAQMDQQHPRLKQTVRESGDRPAAAPDGTIWLGESSPVPNPGPLGRVSDTMRSLVSSRTAIAVVLVVALLVVTFGIRTGSGRKRPQP